MIDKKSVGPSYNDVATRYKGNAKAQALIAKKIITGGAGVWGDHAMSAHPQVSESDAGLMIMYIMGLAEGPSQTRAVPLSGTFTTRIPAGDNGRGGYLLRVAYKDKGTPQLGALTTEKIIALRNATVDPEKADVSKGTEVMTTPSRSFNVLGDDAFIGYRDIDLSGVTAIDFMVQAPPRIGAVGGIIEVHLDSPTGRLIGQTERIVPQQIDRQAAIAKLTAQNSKAGKSKEPPSASSIDFNALRKIMSINKEARLEPIEGEHDVYFVFRNPNAGSGQILVQVVEATFVPE
jgi:cytochrome c